MKPDDRNRQSAAFAAHKREQARRALAMTPAERLLWLESALEELIELQRLAQAAKAKQS